MKPGPTVLVGRPSVAYSGAAIFVGPSTPCLNQPHGLVAGGIVVVGHQQLHALLCTPHRDGPADTGTRARQAPVTSAIFPCSVKPSFLSSACAGVKAAARTRVFLMNSDVVCRGPEPHRVDG